MDTMWLGHHVTVTVGFSERQGILGFNKEQNTDSKLHVIPKSQRTGKSAPFFSRAVLNFSSVLCFPARAIMNSAKSLSPTPRWFSSSVHILDTKDSSSRRARSFSSASNSIINSKQVSLVVGSRSGIGNAPFTDNIRVTLVRILSELLWQRSRFSRLVLIFAMRFAFGASLKSRCAHRRGHLAQAEKCNYPWRHIRSQRLFCFWSI